ncbi:unnamed protein product [Sphagnum tenellum]
MSRTVQQQQQQPSVYLSSLVLFISQHQRPRTYARASGSHHRLPVSQSALLRRLVTTAVLGGVFRLIALESYRLRQPVGRSSVWNGDCIALTAMLRFLTGVFGSARYCQVKRVAEHFHANSSL